MNLTDFLVNFGELKTPEIIEAFRNIKRENFVPENIKAESNSDRPLPIGYNQTISQPAVVAFMLEELSPKKGENILDIGSGSGWTTALLSYIVRDEGKVTGIERVEQLAERSREDIKKYNFIDRGVTEIICKNGYKGYKNNAPYDKILVSAALDIKEIPKEWINQLKEEGIIIAPIKNSIYKFCKREGKISETEYFGFRFVPLINDD